MPNAGTAVGGSPVRYTEDYIDSSAHGLITSGVSNALDLTQADRITGINVLTQPSPLPGTCNCRFVFNTGSGWFKLDNTGAAELVDTQEISYESVIEEGNTIAELTALTNIPALVNSQARFAIAIVTSDPENVKPRVKFSFECISLTQQLTQTVLSPEYEYSDSIVVTGITADSSTSSGGSLTIQGRYMTEVENDGVITNEYSDWKALSELTGVVTDKMQFRAITTASEIGVSQSILNSLKVNYNEGGVISTSGGFSEIVTITEDWRTELRHCRVLVRHAPLDGSYIKCYVTFRNKSIKVSGESLGTGTGQRQTLQLSNVNGIKLDTVRLYYNGMAVTGGYDVNCQTGRIIVTAPAGESITCDYEYGWASEEWTELERDYTESFTGYDQSVYRITMPENTSDELRSIAGIKLVLHTITGEYIENLGTGQGILTTYKLRYPVRNGALTVSSGNTVLPLSRVSIDSDTRYIHVIAPASDSEWHASYEYETEAPVVYEVNGVFSK